MASAIAVADEGTFALAESAYPSGGREAKIFCEASTSLGNERGLSIDRDTDKGGRVSLENLLQFRVAETDGWLVSHRANSALPGYLIISSRRFAGDLSDRKSHV